MKITKEQQAEGLLFVIKKVPWFVFRNGVRTLIRSHFLSRAEGERIQKIARHHYKMTFKEWNN